MLGTMVTFRLTSPDGDEVLFYHWVIRAKCSARSAVLAGDFRPPRARYNSQLEEILHSSRMSYISRYIYDVYATARLVSFTVET